MHFFNLKFLFRSLMFGRFLGLMMSCSGLLLAQTGLKAHSKPFLRDSILLNRYDSLTSVYYVLGETDSMFLMLQKGLALAAKSNNEHYRGVFLLQKARFFKKKYNSDSGLIYAQKAISILRRYKDWNRVSKTMYLKSTFYLDRKDQATAMKELDDVLRLNEKYNVHSNTGAIYNLLAFTFRRLNDTLNEKKYILKELELAEKHNSDFNRLYSFDAWATYLVRRKNYRAAQVYYAKSYAIAKLQKDKEIQVELLLTMGENLICLKEYKKSLTMLRLAEKIALKHSSEPGWKAILSTNYSYLSALFLATAKPKEALKYARRSLALLENQPLRYEYLIRAYTYLAASQKALGNYKEALDSYEQLQKITHSIDVNKDREIAKDIEAKYQLEKTEKEKELYQKTLKIKELALQNEQKQSRLLELMIIFLTLMVAAGYWLFRKNQLYNQQISRKKQELELLNETKDKLFGIIGHDLRTPVADLNNSLAVIEGKNITGEQFYSLIGLLRKKATSLQTILNNLLYWALSQRHTLHTNPQSIPLKTKIEEVLESLQGLIQEKSLQIEGLTDTEAFIEADENHAQIFLYNIIHNAIKFSPVGETIHFQITSQASLVELKVTNSGKRFEWKGSPEALSALPSQFGTLNEKGTGLGLLVCVELMKLNQGTIRACFSELTGTTLELSFPKSSLLS